MALLNRESLIGALQALDQELGRGVIRAEVFVVGGAAMALAYDARRATTDVDAVFVPTTGVRMAAVRVAEQLGPESSWLNDGAKAFMPGPDPDRIAVHEGTNLSVAAASPREILAARLDRDQDDIRFLYDPCGFTTPEEGLDLVESSYPSHVIAPGVPFLLQEMFPPHTRERDREIPTGPEGPGLER